MPDARQVGHDRVAKIFLQEPADLLTAWFPFLTPAAILAWRLPLRLLAPERLFERIKQNLKADGLFVMVNHGVAEAALAETLCVAAGLTQWVPFAPSVAAGPFSHHRLQPPLLSCWRHAP